MSWHCFHCQNTLPHCSWTIITIHKPTDIVTLSIGDKILDNCTVVKMQQILYHSYYQLLDILQFYSLQEYKFAVSDGKYILCCYTFVYSVLWSKFFTRHHLGQWSTTRGPHVALEHFRTHLTHAPPPEWTAKY